VIVHLLIQNPAEIAPAVGRLAHLPGLAGIEVGLPPDSDLAAARVFAGELTKAAQGELPVILRLPLEHAATLSPALTGQDLAAVSLGPPRGALVNQEGRLVRGRLFGPALFPLALAAVHALAGAGNLIPVIGAGGVYTPVQAQAMRAAGAMAVQIDAVLWRGAWRAG
jgi:dihydroorotate dehydrogenase (NAD+) catalytic subunit